MDFREKLGTIVLLFSFILIVIGFIDTLTDWLPGHEMIGNLSPRGFALIIIGGFLFSIVLFELLKSSRSITVHVKRRR